MSRLSRVVIRVLVALVLLGPIMPGSPANAADPLRVLLTGDSIVQGFHGDYTWRYRLYKEFVRQGRPVDFVGSRSEPIIKPGYGGSQYLDPNFDRNHLAQGGSTLKQHVSWIADEVRQQEPDVVFLGAGINDLRHGTSPETTRERLRDWILAVRDVRPTLPIVISPVLDAVDPARTWLSENVNRYNELAAETIASLTTTESPITLVDTTRGWSVTSHTAENLHPNPTGETLIAQRVAETFVQLGHLAGPIDIYRWTSWNRQPRAGVTIKDQRATITWDNQALTGAQLWLRRAGYAGYSSPYTYSGGKTTTSALVPGATYEFRVALVRGRMLSPLGPITRATVPLPPRPAPVSRVVIDARGVHWTKSALATSYVVKFRRANKKKWVTRTTTGLYMLSSKVKRAQVWAVNGSGRSAVRAARR